MPLNLVKLCVGRDSPEALQAWRMKRLAQGGRASIVHTRQTPKRAAELMDGGSLYWVFKGVILVRQPIQSVETIEENGQRRCEITLEDRMIFTAPQPRRPFQGWRYLEPGEAPVDLPTDASGADMPQALAQELRALGAW